MNPSLSQPLRPATPPTAAQTGDQARPLNPAGQKSISGAPATASVDYTSATPKKGPTSSIDEALEKALRRASR
jgi:hypothetical protein